jgi:ABC-type branched-subunit amino acid transport system substrate-binding protein
VAALLVVGTLAACGSTVPPSQRALPAAREAELGSGAEGPSIAVADDTAPTPAAQTAATAVRRAAGGVATTAAPKIAAPRPNGPGVTDKTISIGMLNATNTAAAQAALGNTAVTTGDPKGYAEAVVRDINTHGGVKGRQLDLFVHSYDATSTQSSDQIAQEACADLTQDHKVLWTIGASIPTFRRCVTKAGTVVTAATVAGLTDRDLADSPLFYDVQALGMDALASNFIDELARDGYFTGWDATAGAPSTAPAKVGIVVPDQPAWDQVMARVVLPRLAAHGITVAPADVQRWHFPESAADDSGAVSQIQASILRFRADNVTHVLPMEVNSLGFFAQSAEAQRYRPRYGLNSATSAQQFAGNLVPYAQLKGAIGLGWSPALDLPPAFNPDNGQYSGPGKAHCLAVLEAAGFSFTSATPKAVALVVCDSLYSMREAVTAIPAGAAIDAISLMKALEGFGDKFAIAGLPRARFGPNKHWPVEQGYRWAFHEDCNCMHYVGGPFKLN